MFPCSRRWFCDTAANKSISKTTEDGWSLRARIGMFTIFVTVGSISTFSYTLTSDEEMLFYVYDRFPYIVNTLGPWIGLPIVAETGQLNKQVYFPRKISDLVGDTITAVCRLQSGRVIVIQVCFAVF